MQVLVIEVYQARREENVYSLYLPAMLYGSRVRDKISRSVCFIIASFLISWLMLILARLYLRCPARWWRS